MKMHKIVPIALAAVLFPLAAFAGAFQDQGITLVSATNEGTNLLQFYQNAAGKSFSLVIAADPDNGVQEKVANLFNELQRWKDLSVQDIRFSANNGTVEAIIQPADLLIDGTNIAPFIPSGLYFIIDTSFRYDFRMVKNRVFMKIKGLFIDRGELYLKMKRALENPANYVQLTDPEYIFNKMNELEDNVALLRSETKQAREENNQLRAALVSLQNRGFFGNVMPVSSEKIQKIIALRKAETNLTRKDLMLKLKDEKPAISDWEAALVLGLYFNQIEE